MNQRIAVPLKPNARVVLYEDVDIDSHEGTAYTATFSDYVERHCPETMLLEFRESDVGMARFRRMAAEADGVEIINAHE